MSIRKTLTRAPDRRKLGELRSMNSETVSPIQGTKLMAANKRLTLKKKA